MIFKKCINGSMILIDGVSEVHVYNEDGFSWVQIQRGKEQTTHRLDEPAFILNDEGKTVEKLPYKKIATTNVLLDGETVYKSIVNAQKISTRRSGVCV